MMMIGLHLVDVMDIVFLTSISLLCIEVSEEFCVLITAFVFLLDTMQVDNIDPEVISGHNSKDAHAIYVWPRCIVQNGSTW